jgi:predicted ATPase
MTIADRASASAREGWVFFDRGSVDAAVALELVTGEHALGVLRGSWRRRGNRFS